MYQAKQQKRGRKKNGEPKSRCLSMARREHKRCLYRSIWIKRFDGLNTHHLELRGETFKIRKTDFVRCYSCFWYSQQLLYFRTNYRKMYKRTSFNQFSKSIKLLLPVNHLVAKWKCSSAATKKKKKEKWTWRKTPCGNHFPYKIISCERKISFEYGWQFCCGFYHTCKHIHTIFFPYIII